MIMRPYAFLLLAGVSTASIAETWVEECPWVYYRDPLVITHVGKDEGWSQETDQTNLRLSCGNARVFTATNTMNCMYGSVYRGGYPYRFSKPIPEGVTCERTPTEGSCSFTCTRAAPPPQQSKPRLPSFLKDLPKISPP